MIVQEIMTSALQSRKMIWHRDYCGDNRLDGIAPTQNLFHVDLSISRPGHHVQCHILLKNHILQELYFTRIVFYKN